MAGMQTLSQQGYPHMPDCACAGHCGPPYADGGNSTLTNQNEREIVAHGIEGTQIREHDGRDSDENFSYVQGVYRSSSGIDPDPDVTA